MMEGVLTKGLFVEICTRLAANELFKQLQLQPARTTNGGIELVDPDNDGAAKGISFVDNAAWPYIARKTLCTWRDKWRASNDILMMRQPTATLCCYSNHCAAPWTVAEIRAVHAALKASDIFERFIISEVGDSAAV